MPDRLEHHLRQAEADLSLARGSLERAFEHAHPAGFEPMLRFLASQLEITAVTLGQIRRDNCPPDEPPPRSSER